MGQTDGTGRHARDFYVRHDQPKRLFCRELGIVACAHMADAPRGQKDLAAFAGRLSQRQRRVLGVRKEPRTGKYPAPSQPTFCRLYAQVSALEVERAVLLFQR